MATIIKNGTIASSGEAIRKLAYDLPDMEGQADEYLQRVRNEAIQIVQQARQEAEQIRQQAEQAGKKAAEDAIERILNDKVARQMKTLTPALTAAVAQIEDSREAWLRHWETAAIELASSIAGHLVRRELQSDPTIATTWIREALSLAGGNAEITLRLHPDDHRTLLDQTKSLAATIHPAAPTQIVADPSVSLGGCVVETEFGSIDMQLETQLQRIVEELKP